MNDEERIAFVKFWVESESFREVEISLLGTQHIQNLLWETFSACLIDVCTYIHAMTFLKGHIDERA